MTPMYKAKKKRQVDPNAPPRPTLLGHEKVIKGVNQTIEEQDRQIADMKRRIKELERKLSNQSAYLSELHQRIMQITRQR